MKNIVLVGFMGTGKTAVAKRLATDLNIRYVSTDDIIEEREKRSIKDIFAQNGEAYFRKVEKEAVKHASAMDGAAIAAGGGVVLDSGNMENLRRNGIIICLNASPEDILKRTGGRKHRPLLNVADPLDRIKELLEKRAPYYGKADHQIDTSGKSVKEIAEEIRKIIS